MTDAELQVQGALKTQSREKKMKKKNMTTINPRHIYSTVGSQCREILNTASKNP